MGIFCAARGCNNRQDKRPDLSFYRFPADPERRDKWIAAVKRADWKQSGRRGKAVTGPTRYTRLCSEHFISGAKSNHPLSPDFVPSVFQHVSSPQKRKGKKLLQRFHQRQKLKEKRREVEKRKHAADGLLELLASYNQPVETPPSHDNSQDNAKNCASVGTQTELTTNALSAIEVELQNLRTENINMKEKMKPGDVFEPCSFEGNSDKVKCFTGLPSFAVLMALFNFIRPELKPNLTLDPFQQFLITCMRLRLNLTVQFLAYLFGTSCSTVSRVFANVVSIMNSRLVPRLVVWPERDQLRKTLPVSFRSSFKSCVCIIDCFEIFIEQPRDLKARAQTYSSYKSHNTMKYLIAITPQGVISFISKGWGGRTSDVHITGNSEFLHNLLPGDLVLADRGFTVHDQVGLYCARLEIPAFTKGKKQLTSMDLEKTRNLAAVRIHVERVIGVTRQKYTMLQGTIPITLLQNDPETNMTTLDKIVRVACAMVNVCESVVPFN